MEHILIVGFYAQIYKHNPTVRISFNDYFLDEYDLPDHYTIEDRIPLRNKIDYINPPLLKIYELNLEKYQKLNIDIDIKNNDNNFSNGFMTRYTKVDLECLFLVPKKIFLNYKYYYEKHTRT